MRSIAMQQHADGSIRPALLSLVLVMGVAVHAGEEGYQPLPPGTVRLWDLGQAYGKGLSMGFVGWKDRAQWRPVPYGETPETVAHDVALEGPAFFFNITWRPDSYLSGPVLYRKPEPADPECPRHNLLYRGWYATKGIWEGGGNLRYIKVLKNTPEEVVVQSSGCKGGRDPASTGVVANYGVKGGRPWLEITPASQCSTIGMHGESRIVVLPEGAKDGNDYVYDALFDQEKDKENPLTVIPDHSAKMLLDFVMDDDNLWALMPTPADPDSDPESSRMPLEYRKRRFMLSNQVDGYDAGWSHIGEGPCKRVVSAPYAFFLGQKILIGHLRGGYWHYQKVAAEVQQGQAFHIEWGYAYERKVKGSPFSPGGAWWPVYPGVWRMVSRIGGSSCTTVVNVGKEGGGKRELEFKPPASGKLDYVLIYLYDRNASTPPEVYTPRDIFREAILGEPREAIVKGSAPVSGRANGSNALAPAPTVSKGSAGPSPEERAAADKRYTELRAAIIEGAAAGKREVVTIELEGRFVSVKVVAADERSLTLSGEGIPDGFGQSWAKLAPRDFYGVARRYSGDRQALYEYCLGKGLHKQAEAELLKW